MAKVNLSVSVDDQHLDRFPEVVKRCQAAGMQIEEQMDAIGVITGSIDASKVDVLQQIEGVTHVEKSRSFQIPPPDSPVQ